MPEPPVQDDLYVSDNMVDWKNQELVDAVKQLALTVEDVVGLTEEEDEE